MDVSEKPDALIIDCFESDVRAFVGPNADFYVNRWKKAGNVNKISGIILPLIFTEPIVKAVFTFVSIGISRLVNGWY